MFGGFEGAVERGATSGNSPNSIGDSFGRNPSDCPAHSSPDPLAREERKQLEHPDHGAIGVGASNDSFG